MAEGQVAKNSLIITSHVEFVHLHKKFGILRDKTRGNKQNYLF